MIIISLGDSHLFGIDRSQILVCPKKKNKDKRQQREPNDDRRQYQGLGQRIGEWFLNCRRMMGNYRRAPAVQAAHAKYQQIDRIAGQNQSEYESNQVAVQNQINAGGNHYPDQYGAKCLHLNFLPVLK